MIYLLCIFLLVTLWVLSVRLYLIRKSLGEICSGLSDILGTDAQEGISTNALLRVSSGDPYLRRLAHRLNRHLSTLRSRQLRYENGDRELKEAVTNISHDLRTPLTAMAGYLDLLEKKPAVSGDAEASRYLSVLKNRLDTMKQLTEELFRYSIVLSVREDTPVPLSLNRALEDSLIAHWGSLRQHNITPVIKIPAAPVMRSLDPSSLSRVLTNIINNAVKYSDGDLCVTLAESGTITFSNHAAGLTPVAAAKLFDRFYTVESGSSSTGLGLSIARLLTERMGGSIGAVYESGELRITLQFP